MSASAASTDSSRQATGYPALASTADGEEVIVAAEGMPLEKFETVVRAMLAEARSYNDQLSVVRAEALRLYNGDPFGNEEKGRSRVVLTEVRDTIAAAMPTVIRVFCGAERPVEFSARKQADQEAAPQATDYTQFVVFDECDGFRAIHDAALEAFSLKAGWLKWWWDTSTTIEHASYRGLLEPQAASLITEEGVNALRVVRRPATEDERVALAASPEAAVIAMPGQPLLVFDCDITRRVRQNRPRVGAYPTEDVWTDPLAPCVEEARYHFHVRRNMPQSDLVALGFKAEDLARYASSTGARQNAVTRRRDKLAGRGGFSRSTDPALRGLDYIEGWVRVDWDGDGIAELRRIQACGEACHILAHEPAECIPWAPLSPFLAPHRIVGDSFTDRVGDLQRAMSAVMRNILDNMASTLHPRTEVVENDTNLDDALNTEVGATIRVKKSGAVRELQKPFLGPTALPIMDALTSVREARTGITRTSQGLTAEALQSSTAIAVSAQISAAQDRLEYIIRVLAEGLARLYQGVLGMMCTHQDRPRTVQLRGKWVPVDPRPWKNAFRVKVKVGVGRGSITERVQALTLIATRQQEILTTLGPRNPLVTMGQYRATLDDLMNLLGVVNTERYFQPLPLDFVPEPPPPPPPDPNLVAAQSAVMKVVSDTSDAAKRRALEREKAYLDDDFRRDKELLDATLRAIEISAKYGGPVNLAALPQLMQRNELPPDVMEPAVRIGDPTPMDAGTVPGLAALPGMPGAAPDGDGQADGEGVQYNDPQLIAAVAQATKQRPLVNPLAMAPVPGSGRPN